MSVNRGFLSVGFATTKSVCPLIGRFEALGRRNMLGRDKNHRNSSILFQIICIRDLHAVSGKNLDCSSLRCLVSLTIIMDEMPLIRLASPAFFTETRVRSVVPKKGRLKRMIRYSKHRRAPSSQISSRVTCSSLILRFGIQCFPYCSTLKFRNCTADRPIIVTKGVNVSKNVLKNAMKPKRRRC